MSWFCVLHPHPHPLSHTHWLIVDMLDLVYLTASSQGNMCCLNLLGWLVVATQVEDTLLENSGEVRRKEKMC